MQSTTTHTKTLTTIHQLMNARLINKEDIFHLFSRELNPLGELYFFMNFLTSFDKNFNQEKALATITLINALQMSENTDCEIIKETSNEILRKMYEFAHLTSDGKLGEYLPTISLMLIQSDLSKSILSSSSSYDAGEKTKNQVLVQGKMINITGESLVEIYKSFISNIENSKERLTMSKLKWEDIEKYKEFFFIQK